MVFLFIHHSFPFSSTPLQKGEKLAKEGQLSAMASDCITQKQLLTHVNIIMKHAPLYNRHNVFARMLLYIISFELARLNA